MTLRKLCGMLTLTLSAATSTAVHAQAPAGATLSTASWIAGCWQRQTSRGMVEEQWMAPRGDQMLGMSRTTRDGRVSEYEFIRLFERDGLLVYEASPSGQRTTAFTSVFLSDTLMSFTNPDHDFPTRIVYRRVQPDSLHAEIAGPGTDRERVVRFRFGRVGCGAKGEYGVARLRSYWLGGRAAIVGER